MWLSLLVIAGILLLFNKRDAASAFFGMSMVVFAGTMAVALLAGLLS